MNVLFKTIAATSLLATVASAGAVNAMPVARAGIAAPTAYVETVAYRRHYVRGRVYRRHYGYNPGPAAVLGAIAGIAGAGIAASQQPYYYGYGYPAYGYGYPQGYGYYNGW